MDYKTIRSQSRKAHSKAYAGGGAVRYANGGRVKSAKTVVNVIVPPSGGAGAGAAPPIAGNVGGPGASPRPVPPVPPMAGNAALGAMGAPPMLANGGRVPKGKVPGKMPAKAGAASGEGRLKRARNPKTKV